MGFQSKLTWADKGKIFELWVNGTPIKILSVRFNVSYTTISKTISKDYFGGPVQEPVIILIQSKLNKA